MEQSLRFTQQQKLKMNHSLAQAITILQLSTVDLQALVNKEYMENPLLEMDEEKNNELDQNTFQKTKELMDYFNKDDEKPVTYANDEVNLPLSKKEQLSLEEYLLEQIPYVKAPQPVLKLAKYLAGLIDEQGYLHTSLPKELNKPAIKEIFPQALKLIQSLEPLGVGARNLKECLQIQAQAKNLYQGLMKNVIDHYLEALSKNQLIHIAQELKVTPQDIQRIQDIICKEFNPKPGAMFGKDKEQYIIPDIFLTIHKREISLTYNEAITPHLKISNLYKRGDLDENSQIYLKERLNAALNLVKAIEQRRLTLIKVVEALVAYQREVFFQGLSKLKPLQMKQLAQMIGVHESTVSRAVANKYMATPLGIIPLKDFFAAHLSSTTGEEVATQAVKERLQALIQGENPTKPLSDAKLTALLTAENFHISRRTVMKYREQLGIANSTKRKRY